MKTYTKNNRHLTQSRSLEAFGIQDGVAGSWITPNYLRVQSSDYVPGSKQHLENVARQLNRSVEAYKKELESSYG
ncbi:hypothetical protein [Psychrobacter cibarius]|uniref:hypothetical protein n=1 Tax=Psychrobacter cibarius TaxID=282669 RepID=UPI0018DF6CE2|nr:hypothetical protein [Psychrobacter cibarius]